MDNLLKDNLLKPQIVPEPRRMSGAWWIPALLLFFIPALILVTVNFNYSNPGSAETDHIVHLRAITAYSSHWEKMATNDYSPNIPGYYTFFGAVRRWITTSVPGLRFVNLLLTAGLVWTLALAVSPGCPAPLAVLLATPFMFSDSVFSRAIWLGSDNPAWWGILVLLLLALRRRMSATAYVTAGFAVVCVLSLRQNQIWIVPVMLVAAFLGAGDRPQLAWAGVRRAFAMALAILPSLLVVAWYVLRWRGLVPPVFQRQHQGFSLSALPMTFVLLAIFGAFYLTAVWPQIRNRWTTDRAGFLHYLGAGFAVGLISGVCGESSYLRWYREFGIWAIARHTPVYFGRSAGIVLLSIAGGLVAGMFLLVSARRDRWIFSVALLAFIVAQIPHKAMFERYYEPFVLMLLALAASRIVSAGRATRSDLWRMALGPALLTLLQVSYTVWLFSTPA